MQEAGMMDTDITFQEAEQQLTKFVTNGIKAPGHYFMHTVKESNSIGSFWLQLMKRRSTEAYLWDIFIGEDRRGKGYVKNSTVEIEAFAKNKGATRIFLNVYSLNTVARNLYSKAGFRESAITMLKSL